MHHAVYASNPPPSISELPESLAVLLLAWLATTAIAALWGRSRGRSRLPAVLLAGALLASCTAIPARPVGVWHGGPADYPIQVIICGDGTARARVGADSFELRR